MVPGLPTYKGWSFQITSWAFQPVVTGIPRVSISFKNSEWERDSLTPAPERTTGRFDFERRSKISVQVSSSCDPVRQPFLAGGVNPSKDSTSTKVACILIGISSQIGPG